jgi:hypothetical protein
MNTSLCSDHHMHIPDASDRPASFHLQNIMSDDLMCRSYILHYNIVGHLQVDTCAMLQSPELEPPN